MSSPEYIVAYVGPLYTPAQPQPHCRVLTNWTGSPLGTCCIKSSWRVNSYIGPHMCQIYARINGADYTGRGFGEGMAVRLRRCAKQRL